MVLLAIIVMSDQYDANVDNRGRIRVSMLLLIGGVRFTRTKRGHYISGMVS